jgi:sec-independent protein translocase protein TatA
MFGLGTTELVIILIIVLVVFGAKRLPEIGSGLGRGIKNFKKATKEVEEEVKDAPEIEEDKKSD